MVARLRRPWLLAAALLLAPAVARADDPIDGPMDRDPVIPAARTAAVFPPQLVGLWLRALDRPEADYRCRAALAIAQGKERGMPGLEDTIPALTRELTSPDGHPTARLAAARALVALDARGAADQLFKAAAGDIDLREIAEPALGRWRHAPARDDWLGRLDRPPYQRPAVLAIQGLAAMQAGEAVPRLRAVLTGRQASAAVRIEAAKALGRLRTDGGESDVDALLAGKGVTDRLAAALLLRRHSGADVVRRLQALANDPEPAVAEVALARLIEAGAEHVLPVLPAVLASPDAGVRAVGVDALRQRPDGDAVRLLGERLSDPHPDVRSRARRGLVEIATPGRRAAVIAAGEAALAGTPWEGREQAAVLLGKLGHKPAAKRMVDLLTDPRLEVGTAAAWAVRELAVPETLPAALEHVRRSLPEDKTAYVIDPIDRRLAQLVQFIGAARYRPADDLLRTLPAAPPRTPVETRAAAAWALGRIHEADPPPELVALFAARMAAVVPFDTEYDRVRRMCAVSLGRMKAGLPVLETFYIDKKPSLHPVNNACGWAIEQITGVRQPPPGVIQVMERDWFLTTLD